MPGREEKEASGASVMRTCVKAQKRELERWKPRRKGERAGTKNLQIRAGTRAGRLGRKWGGVRSDAVKGSKRRKEERDRIAAL